MNQYQQDELAQLFAQSMHLAPTEHNHQLLAQPLNEHSPFVPEKHQSEDPITYISAHYTHTAHIRSGDSQSEPSRSPPPPYHEAVMPEALAELLVQYSINPYSLQSTQIQLFMNADDDQRLRLLELWRIAPPSYPQERSQWLPAAETGNGYVNLRPKARSSSISAVDGLQRNAEAEPYIVNGYEADQSYHSVDPVYAATSNQWQAPCYVQTLHPTHDAYASYDQIRNHADWERMNEQMMRERFAGVSGSADDDIVM